MRFQRIKTVFRTQQAVASERKKKGALDNRTVDEEHRFKGYRAFEGGASPPVPARAPAAGYPPATCTQGAEFSAVACFTSV